MRRGEKEILPLWFRTTLVLTLLLSLYFAYSYSLGKASSMQLGSTLDASAHGQSDVVPVALRKLNFVDLDEGAVSIIDAENGKELLLVNKGEDGFVRSVMRGLVRERKAHGIGPDIAFELILWKDGLLSLIDPATSRRVELSAFGADNVAAFSRLLPSTVNAPDTLWL